MCASSSYFIIVLRGRGDCLFSQSLQTEIQKSRFQFCKTLTLDVFLQAQRLPFLHSSNMAVDTLRGNDECIGFEDILNGKYFVLLL